MPDPTPIRQPVADDLRNALQMMDTLEDDETGLALGRAIALVKRALVQLGEPAPHVVATVLALIDGRDFVAAPLMEREARDIAAAILRAAVTK